MLFHRKRPKRFHVRGTSSRARKEQKPQRDAEEEESEEHQEQEKADRRAEIRERIKFKSLRTRRKTGARSLIWLVMLLFLVGVLFWYLSGM